MLAVPPKPLPWLSLLPALSGSSALAPHALTAPNVAAMA
jgi:hypothetical protein